jgi:predicted DNA-binding ribbon-helix-helix protein
MTTLYDRDYGLWAEQMADLLMAGRFSELDIENLVEEVRDLSKRERDRLLSSMRLIVHHFLKWNYQTQRRTRSW